jgi:hypothetical protein
MHILDCAVRCRDPIGRVLPERLIGGRRRFGLPAARFCGQATAADDASRRGANSIGCGPMAVCPGFPVPVFLPQSSDFR